MEAHGLVVLGVERGALVLCFIIGRSRYDLVGLSSLGHCHGCLFVGCERVLQRGERRRFVFGVAERVGCCFECVPCGLARVSDATRAGCLQESVSLCKCGFFVGLRCRLDVVASVGQSHAVQNLVVTLQTGVETAPLLFCLRQPARFAQRQHARQQLIFQLDGIVAGLRPKVALHAEAEVFATSEGSNGVEIVGTLHRVHPVLAPTALVGFVNEALLGGSLIEVKIEALIGHDDALQTVVRRRCALVDVVPRHDDRLHRVRGVPVAQQFVPDDEVFAVFLLQPCAELLDEPGLQFVHSAEPFFLHAAQTVSIRCPLVRGAFVAADVNVLIGEHLGNVTEHTAQEVKHFVLADVQHVLRDAAVDAHGIFL